MKSLGIVRNLNSLGRIIIQKEIKKVIGIDEGYSLGIDKVDNKIVVRKYSEECIFCGSDKDT
ncbi:AbrB/MazE/SpoVT family DNA-binding domain-containing protein [Clostridium saccharobutylicum]|uniref:Transition state regulatory protein AbrB n=1 Tax=Clostridium saccharobutylicum TaxID=169679 RepID=A0A1S8MST5_CLOSA|nr:AbrB/MazE/SpoVT family DNA-binding domain-containing protein [Clostridium saccharobutylicum]OOM07246.1 transition state regulatory protein AbrB [Clostridium saccharobutylicum]